MRKKYIILAVLFFFNITAWSQIQMGFKLSPYFSSNRVNDESNDISVENDGNQVRFTFGPVIDIGINGNENYFFSTGLWLSSKRAGISYINGSTRITQSYSLQYLVIPATMKLYSQEVLPDKKIYFQFGPTLEFKVSDKLKDGDTSIRLVDKYRGLDMSLFMSVGMDWHLGSTTRIYGGLTYSRGLINASKNTISELDDMIYKNDLFGLELGVMF